MFEFLQECNQTIVYNRAKDCVISIRAFNPFTSMAIFIETLFKRIYMEFNADADEQAVGNMHFSSLLNNTRFTQYLKDRYKISGKDLDTSVFLSIPIASSFPQTKKLSPWTPRP